MKYVFSEKLYIEQFILELVWIALPNGEFEIFFWMFFFFFCRMLRLQETKRIVGLSTSRSTNRPALSTLALSPFSMQGLSLMITFAVWRQNSDWLRDDLKPGSSKCTWSKSWSTFPEIQPVDSAPSQVQTCSQPFPVLGFFQFLMQFLDPLMAAVAKHQIKQVPKF